MGLQQQGLKGIVPPSGYYIVYTVGSDLYKDQ